MIVDNKIVDFQIACSNVFFLSTAFTNCLKAKENLSIDISDPKSNSHLIYDGPSQEGGLGVTMEFMNLN